MHLILKTENLYIVCSCAAESLINCIRRLISKSYFLKIRKRTLQLIIPIYLEFSRAISRREKNKNWKSTDNRFLCPHVLIDFDGSTINGFRFDNTITININTNIADLKISSQNEFISSDSFDNLSGEIK